jgi:hypothetical protein
MLSEISVIDPEYGYTIKYNQGEENIDWEVSNPDGDLLMVGKCSKEEYHQSKFTLIPSNVEENVLENLFYLYFENIKLTCIEMFDDKNIEDIEEEM